MAAKISCCCHHLNTWNKKIKNSNEAFKFVHCNSCLTQCVCASLSPSPIRGALFFFFFSFYKAPFSLSLSSLCSSSVVYVCVPLAFLSLEGKTLCLAAAVSVLFRSTRFEPHSLILSKKTLIFAYSRNCHFVQRLNGLRRPFLLLHFFIIIYSTETERERSCCCCFCCCCYTRRRV